MKILLTLVFCLTMFLKVLSQPCLPGGIIFVKQNQIDSFQFKYPGCTTIGGRVTIANGVKNLNGLLGLKSIGGNLSIYDTDSLVSLAGLDSLTTIGGFLYIGNNKALTSLYGLDHLKAGSITDLSIINNPSLSVCGYSSVCSWLSFPQGEADIYYNAPGCDNIADIVTACGGTFACLPEGNYYFLSQNDIDNFPVHYPACAHLEGDVTILGDDITSLQGLAGIQSISGSLHIGYNPYVTYEGGTGLTDLTGLNALTEVQGGVEISRNNHLKSLSGINSLQSARHISLLNNDLLESISGLASLQEVDQYFYFIGNKSITHLSGLDSLKTVSDFWIRSNDKLMDINGFPSLTRTRSTLEVTKNPALVTLSGFNKLKEVYALGIYENEKLTSLAGLKSLNTVNAHLTIRNNPSLTGFTGLESLALVKSDMTISGNDALKTTEGLDSLKEVKGVLEISGNDSLETLIGLNSLEAVGRLSVFGCPTLIDLQGLESLKYSGDGIGISYNQQLTSLNGLEGLTAFDTLQGGYLYIAHNPSLTSIAAIAQLNAGSVRNLIIDKDSLLSYCAIPVVCDYLRTSGLATIRDNWEGCRSRDEVVAACDSLPVENMATDLYLYIFPNPAGSTLNIALRDYPAQMTLLDINGRERLTMELTEQKNTIDTNALPDGVYLVRVVGRRGVAVAKLAKISGIFDR